MSLNEYSGLQGSKKVYMLLLWAISAPLGTTIFYNVIYNSDMSLPGNLLAWWAHIIPSVNTIYQSHLSNPHDEAVATLLNNAVFATTCLCLFGGILMIAWGRQLIIFYKVNRPYKYKVDQAEHHQVMRYYAKKAAIIAGVGGVACLSMPFILHDFLATKKFIGYVISIFGGIFSIALFIHAVCALVLLSHQNMEEKDVMRNS